MDDIGQWLESLGLGHYAEAFAANDIDAKVLSDLTDADLKELGVASLGHRKTIRKAIAALDGMPSVAPLRTASDPERRQLTIMFCDLVGSTEFSRRLDPEELRELIISCQEAWKRAIARYDGYIARFMGDGILVYFGYPTAHEDDAERAVRAGLDVVDSIERLRVRHDVVPRVRVGIATGLVVAGDLVGEGASEERAVLGDTPNLAARLQAAAEPDTVVIADATRRLVEGRFVLDDLGPQALKGFAEPVPAYRAAGVRGTSRFEAATATGLTPFVGREPELSLLGACWTRAKAGEGQVVVLSGEAGIGKSRILREFGESLRGEVRTTLRYQCSPYAVTTAFAPIVDHLQAAAGFERDDDDDAKLDKLEALLGSITRETPAAAPVLAGLLSLPGDRYPLLEMTPQRQKIEIVASLVAQVEALARRHPVLVLIEDVHWMDPSTLEAFDTVVSSVETLPVLVVTTHRPEFRSPWTARGHATHHSLNRLSRDEGRALAARAVGGKGLPVGVLTQILERTDGVPLFVEELTRSVLESGLLEESGDGYVLAGPLASMSIPTTLKDSLMARLDRLARVKEVAQVAACIGREFTPGLLAAVLDRPDLDESLVRLVDAQLVFRQGAGEQARYAFKHALVQDAAYESLLVSRRQQVHARIAAALEAGPRPAPAVLAHHFAAARMHDRSARFYLAAGRRSLGVSALVEAQGVLEAGLAEIDQVAPAPDRERIELDLCTALGAARMARLGWSHRSVAQALERAFPLAERLDDRAALATILWGLCVHYWTRTEFPETFLWLDRLEVLADSTGDDQLSVVRGMSGGCQYFWIADYECASRYTAHVRTTYDEARHGGFAAYLNHDPLVFSLHWAGSLLEWITGHPERAREQVEESLALARRLGHPFNTVFALTAGSTALLMRGDYEAVLAHCEEAHAIVEDQGLGDFAEHVLVSNWRGQAYSGMGEFATGHAFSRLANARWKEAEGRVCSALFWSAEARGLAGLGRTAEALALVDAAIGHCRDTGDRFMEPEVLRMKGALVHADGGTGAAEALFREALATARAHGARSWELRAATSLARLWAERGGSDEARALLEPCYGSFTEGLDTADLLEAKALLEVVS